jgi:peptide/nickel transport system permease protein
MVAYIIRRLAWAVLVLLCVTLITFVIFYKLPPGDPALRFVGKEPTPESIALVRHNLGLDKPFYVE